MPFLQELKPQVYDAHKPFCINMFEKLNINADFLQRIFFSDEDTFHMSSCVNWHNAKIWVSEKTQSTSGHIWSTPKVYVWRELHNNVINAHLFLHDESVNANVYADILEIFTVLLLQYMQPKCLFNMI